MNSRICSSNSFTVSVLQEHTESVITVVWFVWRWFTAVWLRPLRRIIELLSLKSGKHQKNFPTKYVVLTAESAFCAWYDDHEIHFCVDKFSTAWQTTFNQKLKLAYYRNYCIDSNQILHSDKDHQMLFVGGPNTCHISAAAGPISTKFGTVKHFGHFEHSDS